MSKPPVIALWLDAADPDLLEELLAAGRLPHLARLRAEGAYGRLHSVRFGVTEVAYAMLGTGCWPSTMGYWQQCAFDPATYAGALGSLDHFQRHRPFYALGSDHRVVFFDVPQMPVRDDVHGLQLASWGAHASHVPRASRPEGLLAEIVARHGLPPMEYLSGYELEDGDSLRDTQRALLDGLRRREAVLVDLWRRAGRRRWDLLFAAVAETHIAGHALWPRFDAAVAVDAAERDRLFTQVYERADALIGRLVDEAGADAQFAIFSVEGMRGNHIDNGSMLFLPELLVRYSLRAGPVFDFGAPPAHELPPDGLAGWYFHVWRHRVRPGRLATWLRRRFPPARAAAWEVRLGLRPSPYPAAAGEERYLPATWFTPYFPHMKAFALPGFSDGFVRLNVRDRERHGRVAPGDFRRVSDEITALLHDLVDEHGRAVVEEVIRTRRQAGERGPGVPPADLVVRWSPHCSREVRSPRLGRFGPTLPMRLGNHTAHGFLLARGPGFTPGSTLPAARVVDVAPTLMAMVGAPAPPMDGRSLLDAAPAAAPGRPGARLADPGQPDCLPARLAMVLCARDEEDFLLANLLYHRALGVERAYVYLDQCTDRSAELVSGLAGVRLFEVAPAERARFQYVGDLQAACMTYALALARQEGFTWLLTVDPDEFASGVDREEAAPPDGGAVAACDLRRLVAHVPPESLQVVLATKECVPADLGDTTPFWRQRYFQAEPVPRELHDPLTGETRVWTEFLGHDRGKPLLRTTANAQGYHSHRWVLRQAPRPTRAADGRFVERRPVDDPLPSSEAGSLYHFNVVSARHWRAKYRKVAAEPPVWPSGHPVEWPRDAWRRASQALDPAAAAAYFARWIALPATELAGLHAAGRLTWEGTVEAVLRATGCLDGDRLRIPSGQQARRPARLEPATLLRGAGAPEPWADGRPWWRRLGRRVREGAMRRPAPTAGGQVFPADLPRSDLRGFHPIEAVTGEAFCWTMPDAAVRLTLRPGDYDVTVHTRQLAGLWSGRLAVGLGDGPLRPCEPVDAAGAVRFRLRAAEFPAGERWLRLSAPPVDTAGWPGEWRALSVPIFEIVFSPAADDPRVPGTLPG